MRKTISLFFRGVDFIAATMLAAMFLTFLLQILARYVLSHVFEGDYFGWTVEFCLILWLWIVFFCCAFMVRERDHVTFDILYLGVSSKVRQIFALVAAACIVLGMLWSLLPTIDYLDFQRLKKTSTVRNFFTGDKISLRVIFSIYGIFMVTLILRYTWRFIDVIKNGAPDEDHELVSAEEISGEGSQEGK